MARRKGKRRKAKKKISVAMAAGVAMGGYNVYNQYKAENDISYGALALFPYRTGAAAAAAPDQPWYWKSCIGTYVPIVGGVVVSKVATKLGVNRLLSGLPVKI